MTNIFIIVLFLLSVYEGPGKSEFFRSPLDIPLVLSANFGEPRSGHFHSGVDFKTGGITGKTVHAVAPGYIYRISVSPTGFGKAVYLKHNNGLSTVYGHLEAFSPEIDEYVKKVQYRNKSFSVNVFPDPGIFTYKEGDIIGYSGNSGSSGGPHLHFEVRKSTGEKPVDPSQYYNIEDNIKPVIGSVVIYPLKRRSVINGSNEKLIINVKGNSGSYSRKDNSGIILSGPVGFGVNTWDFINNRWNRCGVRIINLKVDNSLIYSHTIDEFSFSETRYINSHIDFEENVRNNTYIQKMFVEPNNRLSIYNHLVNKGIVEMNDGADHKIEIGVSDFNGNYSKVEFMVRSDTTRYQPDEKLKGIMMPSEGKNQYYNSDIRLSFPEYCFYDTLYFDYKKSPSPGNEFLSDLHYVHSKYVPVHKNFNIGIRPEGNITEELKSKLCLIYIDEEDMKNVQYSGGKWNEGFIEGNVGSFGIYSIGLDTVPPEVRLVRFHNGDSLGEGSSLNISIVDRFSGIKDYEGIIDGKWALFEYDPKNSLISYKPDPDYLDSGNKHHLILKVRDNLDNETAIELDFYFRESP